MFQKDIFKGQKVVVTGGGSGIGYTTAKHFLQYGAEVLIASRKEEKLIKAQTELQEFGVCEYQVCDIREVESVELLAEKVKSLWGSLDILINNAGGQFPSRAEDIKIKGWNAVINNNLNGTWYVSQILAKAFFIPQKSGNIINIIANVFRGFPGMAHTGAARAGVDNLTKSLAVEWSPYQIRVNAVAPGIIKSTGLEQYPDEILKGLSDQIPLKTLGSTEDVANLTTFLASPMAKFITGETVYLDGGQRLWGDVFKV
ncbi:SDR family oxidoreductase [Sediminitomix flava]|uniref:Peroxisomal trans-2-enoyl-CoA reductase n=1 Tax=Sediminitomix flava TaxID=379075 RepID=A0A315ZEE0_SEDFL|nr:SDR family oxidoreductase [Sediminitomix flava]PWJ43935.1 citronellol/citronellal dehydrogenase [Sediminitomix flava]